MVNKLYTIGYAGFAIQDFVDVLKANNINVVVDVRSVPYSGRYKEFNKKNIQAFLDLSGISYSSYASEFGARQEDTRFYSCEGFLDFNKFSLSDSFLFGFDRIKKSMSQNNTHVLMCAEKDPLDCHRAIMISKVFYENRYEVDHLLFNSKSISQDEIERQLLETYFPNYSQISLCDYHDKKDILYERAEFIELAYKKRNEAIGHRMSNM